MALGAHMRVALSLAGAVSVMRFDQWFRTSSSLDHTILTSGPRSNHFDQRIRTASGGPSSLRRRATHAFDHTHV